MKQPHSAMLESGSSEETEDEPHPSTSQRGSASRRPRGRGQGRRRATASTSASSEPSTSSDLPEERWFGISDLDVTPAQPTFRPAHPPGRKLIHKATYTALQLFQLYFTNSVIQTIMTNTNEYGAATCSHTSPSLCTDCLHADCWDETVAAFAIWILLFCVFVNNLLCKFWIKKIDKQCLFCHQSTGFGPLFAQS